MRVLRWVLGFRRVAHMWAAMGERSHVHVVAEERGEAPPVTMMDVRRPTERVAGHKQEEICYCVLKRYEASQRRVLALVLYVVTLL